MEKEALAIKWTLDKLRYYLIVWEFTLVTDHAPLKWMAGAKDTNARVTRWFLALQDFHFKVDHRPGKEQANADALSRRDACLGWNPGDQRLHQAVVESTTFLNLISQMGNTWPVGGNGLADIL